MKYTKNQMLFLKSIGEKSLDIKGNQGCDSSSYIIGGCHGECCPVQELCSPRNVNFKYIRNKKALELYKRYSKPQIEFDF